MAKLFLTVFRSFETTLLSNFYLLYIIQKPPFCESSSPFLFDLPGEFSNQGLTARWKYCFRMSFQNINPLGWHHCLNFVIIEDVLRRKPRVLIMHRMKRVKSFQPPCGFGVRNFYGSRGSPWPILTRERQFFLQTQEPLLCVSSDRFSFTFQINMLLCRHYTEYVRISNRVHTPGLRGGRAKSRSPRGGLLFAVCLLVRSPVNHAIYRFSGGVDLVATMWRVWFARGRKGSLWALRPLANKTLPILPLVLLLTLLFVTKVAKTKTSFLLLSSFI